MMNELLTVLLICMLSGSGSCCWACKDPSFLNLASVICCQTVWQDSMCDLYSSQVCLCWDIPEEEDSRGQVWQHCTRVMVVALDQNILDVVGSGGMSAPLGVGGVMETVYHGHRSVNNNSTIKEMGSQLKTPGHLPPLLSTIFPPSINHLSPFHQLSSPPPFPSSWHSMIESLKGAPPPLRVILNSHLYDVVIHLSNPGVLCKPEARLLI